LFVGILLSVVGLGIIGFWLIHIKKGGLAQGLRTLESGGFIAFHVIAEIFTGIICLIAGIALAVESSWAYLVALMAGGMLLYTSINSLAWKEVRSKPALSIMFIVPVIIAIISIMWLLIEKI